MNDGWLMLDALTSTCICATSTKWTKAFSEQWQGFRAKMPSRRNIREQIMYQLIHSFTVPLFCRLTQRILKSLRLDQTMIDVQNKILCFLSCAYQLWHIHNIYPIKRPAVDWLILTCSYGGERRGLQKVYNLKKDWNIEAGGLQKVYTTWMRIETSNFRRP